jgi:hypothetical protein
MDHHDTFSVPHVMIPNTFTLSHPISSITPSSFTHSTFFLPHQSQAILQSSTLTSKAHPSHQQCLCFLKIIFLLKNLLLFLFFVLKFNMFFFISF